MGVAAGGPARAHAAAEVAALLLEPAPAPVRALPGDVPRLAAGVAGHGAKADAPAHALEGIVVSI